MKGPDHIGPAWVYRVYDTDGRLIYVGHTTNLPRRLAGHRSSSWWASQAAKVRAKVYPGVAAAFAAEKDAIRAENPRWNTTTKWQTRHAWSLADWDDYILAHEARPYLSAVARQHVANARRLRDLTFRPSQAVAA